MFLKKILAAFAALALSSSMAIAQPVYPTNNPTYIPNAVLPYVTLTTTGYVDFNANGVSSASLNVSALTGTLSATVQASNDPLSTVDASATWTTLPMIPAGGGSPITTLTANGVFRFNISGYTRFRVNVATLSGGGATVTFNAAANLGTGINYNWNASPYPYGATPITASATGTTAATTATLAAVSGKTTYICGLSIKGNATAAATGNATVTGTITGTLNFTEYTAALASGIGSVDENFSVCVPASAANTAISVFSAAPGSGGTVSVSAWGYQL